MAKEYLLPTTVLDVLDDNDVTETKIANSAVTTVKIADDAVTAAKVDLAGVAGNFTFDADKLEVSGTPSNPDSVPNKAYVDSVAAGLTDVKNSCRVATTTGGLAATRSGNVLTSDAFVSINGNGIDGVTSLALNDRVLVKDQVTGADNGIYTVTALGSNGVSAWTLTRSTDADTSAEVTPGLFTFIEEGTTNGDTGWLLTTDAPITLNTTSLSFTQFSSAGEITAGAGLTKTGNTIDVGAGDGIIVNSNDVAVNYGGAADLADVTKAPEAAGTSTKVARADHKHDVTTGVPVAIGDENLEGVATELARADHLHDHGVQSGPNMHALATTSAAGFMSSTQFDRVDLLRKATVTTTDATVTALFTYALSLYTGVVIRAMIIAYNDTTDTGQASFELVAEFHRGSGAAGQNGSTTVVRERKDDPAWEADFVLSGASIQLQVTGVAATNIKWGAAIQIMQVNGAA